PLTLQGYGGPGSRGHRSSLVPCRHGYRAAAGCRDELAGSAAQLLASVVDETTNVWSHDPKRLRSSDTTSDGRCRWGKPRGSSTSFAVSSSSSAAKTAASKLLPETTGPWFARSTAGCSAARARIRGFTSADPGWV